MNRIVIAEIQGNEFSAFIEEDGKHATIYDETVDDDPVFMGRLELDGDNLIEIYPMTNRRVVVGKIKRNE